MVNFNSKLIVAVMVIFGITAFMGCKEKQDNKKSYNVEAKNIKSNVYSGEYKIEYRENEVGLFHYRDEAKSKIDFGFVLQTENPVSFKSIDLGECLVSFENNNRIIVINQLETKEVRILALNEEKDINYLQKADEKKDVNVVAKTFGYGISMVKGYWQAKSIFENDGKFTELLVSRLDNSTDTTNEEGVNYDCTSGGQGAIACSLKDAYGRIGCSVTCVTGYYACCIDATMICKCVKE